MNTEKKVYVLQKDLPDYKVGETFTWHEQSECYTATTEDEMGQTGKWPAIFVENNPEWFLPKVDEAQKRIEVDVFGASWSNTKAEKLIIHLVDNLVSPDKFPQIKQAIEDVLNNDKLVEHKCKFCGLMTTEDDKHCFKNPDMLPKKTDGFGEPIANYFVKEKEYEILEYRHILLSKELGKNITIDKTSNKFYTAYQFPEDYEIFKVRRTSDGEVFTVGEFNNAKEIIGFNRGWNGMEILYKNGGGALLLEAKKDNRKPTPKSLLQQWWETEYPKSLPFWDVPTDAVFGFKKLQSFETWLHETHNITPKN